MMFPFPWFWTKALPSPESVILSDRSEPQGRSAGSRRICGCFWNGSTPLFVLFAVLFTPLALHSQSHFDGAKAYEYAREFAAIGPRWPTGPGHVKAQEFLRAHFLRNHDQLEEDTFTADTPIGPVPMCNFIVRFAGKKPGVIVLGTHYETNYPLRNINFVGANDGASTTGLLMAIADQLRAGLLTRPARNSTGTRSGWSSSTAKRPSSNGRAPTPPTAAAIWPQNGAATVPSATSRPLSLPT